MSGFLRRAIRIAQANINGIREKASSAGRSRTLGDISDAELEAELERRKREIAAQEAAQQGVKKEGMNSSRQERKRKNGASRQQKTKRSSQSTGQSETLSEFDFLDLPPQKRRQIRQYYINLELPFGADLEEVKQAYRRLMRQYHPDKHENDPTRRELATQLTQKLTVAYNELTQLLKKKNKK